MERPWRGKATSPLVEGKEGPSGKLLCLWQPQKNRAAYGNIPYLFDFWADPFVHLLLLKSSMVKVIVMAVV